MNDQTSPPAALSAIPWPPLLMVSGAAMAIGVNWLAPTSELLFDIPEDWQFLGAIIALSAFAWDLWAMLTMWNAKTNILPTRAADKLISHGPFAYSRNPIYLGNALLLAALALALNNLWFLIAAIDFAVLVFILAIKPEEAHMEDKFGYEWQLYKERTPRWALWF